MSGKKSAPLLESIRASELISEEKYSEALSMLLEAEQRDGSSAAVHVLEDIAVCLIKLERSNEAREYLEKILQRNPGDPVARYNLAWCKQESGDYVEAFMIYESLEKEEGGRVDLLYPMGHCSLLAGKPDKALLYFREVLNSGAGAEMAYRMGAELIDAGRFSEARDIFTAWLMRHPGDIDAVFALGIAYTRLSEPQKAIECFTRVLGKDDGKYESLPVTLAGCYWSIGQKTRARAVLEEAIEQGPPMAEAWFTKGSFYEQDGNDELALSAYKEAGNIDHRFAPAWERAGDVAARLSRLDDARICYKKTWLITRNPVFAWKQGLVQLMSGDHAGALESFIQAGPGAGGNDWHQNVSLCRYRTGDFSGALDAAREAVKRGKRDPMLYFLIGSSLAKLGNNAEASKTLREGLAIYPKDVNLLYSMGLLLANQLQFEEAVVKFKEALRISGDPEILYALSLAYYKLGSENEAVIGFESYAASNHAEPNNIYRSALYLLELGAREKAEDAMKKAVLADPSNAKAREFLSDLAQGKRK